MRPSSSLALVCLGLERVYPLDPCPCRGVPIGHLRTFFCHPTRYVSLSEREIQAEQRISSNWMWRGVTPKYREGHVSTCEWAAEDCWAGEGRAWWTVQIWDEQSSSDLVMCMATVYSLYSVLLLSASFGIYTKKLSVDFAPGVRLWTARDSDVQCLLTSSSLQSLWVVYSLLLEECCLSVEWSCCLHSRQHAGH
jgi:hypothetical protein